MPSWAPGLRFRVAPVPSQSVPAASSRPSVETHVMSLSCGLAGKLTDPQEPVPDASEPLTPSCHSPHARPETYPVPPAPSRMLPHPRERHPRARPLLLPDQGRAGPHPTRARGGRSPREGGAKRSTRANGGVANGPSCGSKAASFRSNYLCQLYRCTRSCPLYQGRPPKFGLSRWNGTTHRAPTIPKWRLPGS